MPWRGPQYDGEFPSLGWGVVDWAEATFRVPDGPFAGQPLELTDEQVTIIVRFYAIDDRGRFVLRRAAVRRAQGWGKSPLLAVAASAELCGPVRFGGWDADGEPVGIAPTTPWVQVASVSEDSTDNTYNAVYAMCYESELNGSVLDVGKTRVFLKNEPGRLEPVTASAGSRLGQRVTFAVLDETHLWTARNGGHKLASTIRRNAGKMGGRTFESTNAHLPGEDSVAERTYAAAGRGAPGLLYDSVEAPEVEDLSDGKAVLEALRIAYGDSAAWVDLDRIVAEIADPGTADEDARRYYLNQLVAGELAAVDPLAWQALTRTDRELVAGERIGLGFDGSIRNDATALIGCTADGHLFEINVWERPADASADWRIPRLEVERVIEETFELYEVGRMLCDPPRWQTEIERWAERYNADRRVEDAVVMFFDTNQTKRMSGACERFSTALAEGAFTHDGSPTLSAHVVAMSRHKVKASAADDDGRTRYVFTRGEDRRKIDAGIGAVLALEAAMTMPERAPAPEPWAAVV